MAAYLSKDTTEALGTQCGNSDSRSLFLSRYADPNAKDGKDTAPRKDWFNALIRRKAQSPSRGPWLPSAASLLYGRLTTRLLVGMANGVMENAGLTLDRFGLPLIPGSAVKGCARRAAIAALREWGETGVKPAGAENLFTPLCAPFESPACLLVRIALVFGWVEQDWSTLTDKSDRLKSDFAWGCGSDFEAVRKLAAKQLADHLTVRINSQHENTPWLSLPNFAGTVAFLAAQPNKDPGLVLDVVTCHHGDYYSEKEEPKGRLKMPVALDTEEPVPVLFPAIREQTGTDHFTFPILPLRRADASLVNFARQALALGLDAFGIGAKTNAGYGCFDVSEAFGTLVSQRLAEDTRTRDELARQAEAKARQDAELKAKAEAKAALDAALEGLSPEQKEDKKVEFLTDAQFDTKVRAFCKDLKRGGSTEPEKQAIVRALRGSRLSYWQSFKTKATKGDLATVDQAIRAVSKTLNLGKMP